MTGDSAIQGDTACDIVPFVPKPSEQDEREKAGEAGGELYPQAKTAPLFFLLFGTVEVL